MTPPLPGPNRDPWPDALWTFDRPDVNQTVNLGDEGLTEGDDVSSYVAQYRQNDIELVIPAGEYVSTSRNDLLSTPGGNYILRGDGGLGGVVIEQTDGLTEGPACQVTEAGATALFEGFDLRGQIDGSANSRILVRSQEPDGQVIFKHVRQPDGVMPGQSSGTQGWYIDSNRTGAGHQGCARFLWCQASNFDDNGIYGDGPNAADQVSGDGSPFYGQVIVVGGYYGSNNISNVRLGNPYSTAYGVTIEQTTHLPTGMSENYRGIWIRQPDDTEQRFNFDYDLILQNCDINFPYNSQGGSPITAYSVEDESTGLADTIRIYNNSDNKAISIRSGTNFDDNWTFDNIHIHGESTTETTSDATLTNSPDPNTGDMPSTSVWWGIRNFDPSKGFYNFGSDPRGHGLSAHGTSPHGVAQDTGLGAAQLNGIGLLDASAVRSRTTPVSLTSAGSLTATGTVFKTAGINFNANGSLTATGTRDVFGSVAFKGVGSLSVQPFLITPRELTITDAYVEVFRTTNVTDEPDWIIDERFEAIDINSYAHKSKDEGELTFDNPGGELIDILRVGRRIKLVINTAENPHQPFSWTAWIGPRDIEILSHQRVVMTIEGEDFVGGVLSNRNITDSYLQESVEDIITEIHRQKAPTEIELDLDPMPLLTDEFLRQANVWDAIGDLANKADALILTEGRTLKARKMDSLELEWDLLPSDYGLPVSARTNPDNMFNRLRTDSGEADALEEENTGVDSYVTVTDTNRETFQVRARKAEISRIRLVTRQGGNDGQMSVRLQADEGGQPIDVNDRESDLARRTLSEEFLGQEDWVSFLMPEHTLSDRDPWVIIEAGEDGQDVAVDSTGDVVYETYYPYPLNIQLTDVESRSRYRLREEARNKQQLDTISAVRDWTQAQLRRRKEPERMFTFPVTSERAYRLIPGEVVNVSLPDIGAEGWHVVMEKNLSADASSNAIRLDGTITLQDIDTI